MHKWWQGLVKRPIYANCGSLGATHATHLHASLMPQRAINAPRWKQVMGSPPWCMRCPWWRPLAPHSPATPPRHTASPPSHCTHYSCLPQGTGHKTGSRCHTGSQVEMARSQGATAWAYVVVAVLPSQCTHGRSRACRTRPSVKALYIRTYRSDLERGKSCLNLNRSKRIISVFSGGLCKAGGPGISHN